MHFDKEMEFQYLGPGITVLSPSDPRPSTVAALKLGLGKQRLRNSYLKTGAGKAEVEQ